MTVEKERLTFRLSIANSLCWERDPDLGQVKLESMASKTGLTKISLILHHSIREPPKAGALPCHFSELWSLNVSGYLDRKKDSPLSRILTHSIRQNGKFATPESWISSVSEYVDGLSLDQVRGSCNEVLNMFSELDAVAQKSMESVGWCLGARSSSRIMSRDWPAIDCRDLEGYFEIPLGNDPSRWKLDRIDTADFVADAEAPFSSVLLGEAWQALTTSDRTAAVIGYTAAESGAKECFADLIKGGSFLVDGVQAPPLPSLVQTLLEYIDDDLRALLEDETVWGEPRHPLCAASSWLRKRAYQRNRIVHGDDVRLALSDVVDWLFLYERILTVFWLAQARTQGRLQPAERLHQRAWETAGPGN